MAERTRLTPEAAKILGVHHLTLHRWIKQGLIEPKSVSYSGGRRLYQWTDADIEKARKVKGEQKLGRPPKKK